jgi:hypothetical protein
MARPEEIAAKVVGFVAGDGASYLGTTTIFVDGESLPILHSSR